MNESNIPSDSPSYGRVVPLDHEDNRPTIDLLMRHSSPFNATATTMRTTTTSSSHQGGHSEDNAPLVEVIIRPSPLRERTSSPSLLMRPRSNPRTRTNTPPLGRYSSPILSHNHHPDHLRSLDATTTTATTSTTATLSSSLRHPHRIVEVPDDGDDEALQSLLPSSSSSSNHNNSNNNHRRPRNVATMRTTTTTTGGGGPITIRPNAGRSVGTVVPSRTLRSTRIVEETDINATTTTTSRKQGPSHRKVRRWNNDNFVYLANELYKNNKKDTKGRAAAQALLKGHAKAVDDAIQGKIRSLYVYDDHPHSSNHIMKKLFKNDDQTIVKIRDQFYEGELHPQAEEEKVSKSTCSRRSMNIIPTITTPEDMLFRIEPRLRTVLLRACENSMPASFVVTHAENFILQTHSPTQKGDDNDEDDTFVMVDDGDDDNDPSLLDKSIGKNDSNSWWHDILLEPPSVTYETKEIPIQEDEEEDPSVAQTTPMMMVTTTTTTRFIFDGTSSNGGFHRLLIHGMCQFHGLKASSSTIQYEIKEQQVQGSKNCHQDEEEEEEERSGTRTTVVEARLLVATGTIARTTTTSSGTSSSNNNNNSSSVRMVDYIMHRKAARESGGSSASFPTTSTTSCPMKEMGKTFQTLKV